MVKHLLCLVILLSSVASAEESLPDRRADIRRWGDAVQILNPLLGVSAAWYLDDYEGLKEWGQSQGANFLLTYALKPAFNHVEINGVNLGERPNGSKNNFPSGHTSSACAGAYFIGQRYGWQYGAVPMTLAVVTGISREENQFHTTDAVIAGCLLGIATTHYFTTAYHNAKGQEISFQPIVGVHHVWGIVLQAAY